MKELHEIISEYRKSRGITQVHISNSTGINNKRLSSIEKGKSKLRADEFLIICEKGFGINPYFFTEKFLDTKNT